MSGKDSDHKIVFTEPLNSTNDQSAVQKRIIKQRPLIQSGVDKFTDWLMTETWEQVYEATTAHEKAQIFQNLLIQNFENCFPEKVQKFSSEDEPWFNSKLKALDRKRKRLYSQNGKNEKWKNANKIFRSEVKQDQRTIAGPSVAHFSFGQFLNFNLLSSNSCDTRI